MKLYLFDVCGTLFKENTTTGAIKYFLFQTKQYLLCIIFIFFTSKLSPCFYFFMYIEKKTNVHLMSFFLYCFLKGQDVFKFNKIIKDYILFLIENKKISYVWDMIDTKDKEDIIIIASASIEPVVAAIATAVNILYYVASDLEQKDGVFTGRYLNNIAGCKEKALIKKYGNEILKSGDLYVVSDNISDRSLLERAKNAYVVLHKKQHRCLWNGIDVNFIEI
jgi:phosphoserine phosphatase